MISRFAVIETDKIGVNVEIQEFSVVRSNVKVGNNVVIHPHVVIESGVTIGDNVEIFPGSYIGKVPKGAGATARIPQYDKKIIISNDCSIGPNAVIFYDVEIGEHTLLGDGASIREQCVVGSHCIISRYVTVNYNTTIGNYTKIMDNTHITGNCVIGNKVFISLCVGTTNDNAIGKHGYDEEKVVGPVIEDGAVVGVGASLLPGVIIGENAVIGAGSVVTKNVPNNTLVMGVPAKQISKN